jgi:asparagine synthase (glutamine-hydrolysing)
MFSFVLLDESVSPSRIIAARDPIGITTLYQGWSSKRPGAVFFASELKALVDECDKIISFPPGHVYDSRDQSTTRYYNPTWWVGDDETSNATIPNNPADLTLLRETLEAAVRKRLMSEVPYGVLLSGGLDSSLIAAIAARETEKVAQAQYELRQKKLHQASSGPPTPTPGLVTEQGQLDIFVDYHCTTDISIQPLSRPGLSSILSPLVWKTPQTSWPLGRRLISWGRCTTNMFLPFKKV